MVDNSCGLWLVFFKQLKFDTADDGNKEANHPERTTSVQPGA
jgi:hypothetical protein